MLIVIDINRDFIELDKVRWAIQYCNIFYYFMFTAWFKLFYCVLPYFVEAYLYRGAVYVGRDTGFARPSVRSFICSLRARNSKR